MVAFRRTRQCFILPKEAWYQITEHKIEIEGLVGLGGKSELGSWNRMHAKTALHATLFGIRHAFFSFCSKEQLKF